MLQGRQARQEQYLAHGHWDERAEGAGAWSGDQHHASWHAHASHAANAAHAAARPHDPGLTTNEGCRQLWSKAVLIRCIPLAILATTECRLQIDRSAQWPTGAMHATAAVDS
jgi:hypothetical protein